MNLIGGGDVVVYAKGDAVVYPMHGAGIIEDFEEKNIDGICRSYCVLRIPIGDLTIMLEASAMENVNLRKVMTSCDIARVMNDVVKMPTQPTGDNWNKRYKDNLEKIKSGRLSDAAMVFRSLYSREKQRGLSSAEKKMLSNVKKIMLSEIMLSYDVERPEAEEILEKSMIV
jgi:CarD family transcriptional regulator